MARHALRRSEVYESTGKCHLAASRFGSRRWNSLRGEGSALWCERRDGPSARLFLTRL